MAPRHWFLLVLVLLGTPLLASAADLVVMTYNVLRPAWGRPGDPAWTDRVGGIAELIKTQRPDLIGIQEEDETMVADLLARLDGYAYLYPVPEKGAGMLFRYRDWTPVAIRRETGTDGREVVEVLMKGPNARRLYFYNAHFSPFEEPLRMAAAQRLQKLMATRAELDVPVVLTGDLNCTPGSAPLRYLTTAADGPHLTDVFQALGLPEDRTSDSYADPSAKTGRKIDHILFAGALKPTSTSILRDQPGGIFPSDHLPVISSFVWPSRN